MSDLSHSMNRADSSQCPGCGALERVRYFPRQLLTADDLATEQAYHREKMRRHNRYLHGWGVVCGCSVEPIAGASGWRVRVSPGYAIAPTGDEIQICEAVDIDLKLGVQNQPCTVHSPCPPVGEMPPPGGERTVAYVAARYGECYSRPVRVHPGGCGCDESACEYSRIRESFEFKVLWQLPDSHRRAAQADARWCERLHAAADALREHTFPVPPCPDVSCDPWVVLATVALPGKQEPKPGSDADASKVLQVSYKDRRVLLSAQHLQVALACLRD
jgi:hypothetical protein